MTKVLAALVVLDLGGERSELTYPVVIYENAFH
jgi:hypothetical protein